MYKSIKKIHNSAKKDKKAAYPNNGQRPQKSFIEQIFSQKNREQANLLPIVYSLKVFIILQPSPNASS